MSSAWFVCPYDTVPRPGSLGRRCAVARYIPAVPNPDGSLWEEAEILGNHTVVKVIAPDSVLATIRADTDFTEVPIDQAMIDVALRATIRAKLLALGYLLSEILNADWIPTQLLLLLTTAVSDVVPNGDLTGFVWTSARRVAPKTVAIIEDRLRG